MKWIAWALGAVLLLGAAQAIWMRTVSHDAAEWHVDPATAARADGPRDRSAAHLAAPEGTTAAVPDSATPIVRMSPRELLFLFDAIARNAPRTEIVGGSVDDLHVTYVQHSAVFGYPDYISVKAVAVGETEAALIVWSRSRFGRDDFGVNAARVAEWLSKTGATGG